MIAGELDDLIVRPTVAVAAIVAVSRLLGLLFRRRGQPQVIGEFLAGLLLGPSLLGWIAPGPFVALFPAQVLPALKLLSDYGIIFFMFLVGLELDPALLRRNGRATTVIAVASIAAPLLLGAAVAWLARGVLVPPGVAPTTFTVFFSVALSITAFPILARILIERDLARTRLGALTLACAATNDLSAWCLLAAVLAMARGGSDFGIAATALQALGYVALTLFLAPRLGLRLEQLHRNRGGLTQDLLAIVLLLLFASALAAHWSGIHVIFGAFLFGATLPKGGAFARQLSEKIEDLTTVFLLPIYFAYTGIRTDVRLLDSPAAWLVCALVIIVATAGKVVGSGLAARVVGLPWREAAALGALMNTRGLMELIILNVGLDLGIIDPTLFTAMVVMAITTTLAATPALDYVLPARLRGSAAGEAAPESGAVLVPVAFADSGPRLLELAIGLASSDTPRIYALHVPRPAESGVLGANAPRHEAAGKEALAPLTERAAQLGLAPHPLTVTSNNPAAPICEVARLKGVELIVMGWHRPAFRRSVLGTTFEGVMRGSDADVAVFVDRGEPRPTRRILVPFTGTAHDRAALQRALNLARRNGADVTVLHVVRPGGTGARLESDARGSVASATADRTLGVDARVVVVEAPDPIAAVLTRAAEFDLVAVGIGAEWDLSPFVLGVRQERIAAECPVALLIVRAGSRQGRSMRL